VKYFKIILFIIPFSFFSCIPDSKEKKQEEVVFPDEETVTEESAEVIIDSTGMEDADENHSQSINGCYELDNNFVHEKSATLYDEADSLYYVYEYQESINKLNELSLEDGENIRVLLLYALNYSGLDDYDESVEYFSRMLVIDSECFMAYSNRSLIYYLDDQYENAIEDARNAIRLKPDCSFPYLTLGKIFIMTENEKRGCNCFRKVVRIGDDPVNVKDAKSWFRDNCY